MADRFKIIISKTWCQLAVLEIKLKKVSKEFPIIGAAYR